MAERAVLLELHDVAPWSWPIYRAFLGDLEALGPIVISWLLVPDFHRRQRLETDGELRGGLERRLAAGDEAVLHGYCHLDDGPPPRSLRQWWLRRQFTHEAEFSTLSEAQAADRLAEGRALFERLGWPLHGFVAPGWLLGPEARRALAASGLRWSADLQRLYRLPEFDAITAPAVVWSVKTAWRRQLSRRYGDFRLARHAEAPLLRLGVHPVDLQHAEARRYWLSRLEGLLDGGRIAVTPHRWLAQRDRREAAA